MVNQINAATSPLLAAIDYDAYEWLTSQAPHFLLAIEKELKQGRTPEEIRYMVSSRVGPDRQGLALRCEQAARYITAVAT